MAGNRQLLKLRNARDRALELRWQQALDPSNPDAFGTFCQFFVNITTDVPGQRVPLLWNRIQRRFCARRLGWEPLAGLLTPWSRLALPFAMANSAWVTLRQGGVRWRGTFYPLAQLRRGQAP